MGWRGLIYHWVVFADHTLQLAWREHVVVFVPELVQKFGVVES